MIILHDTTQLENRAAMRVSSAGHLIIIFHHYFSPAGSSSQFLHHHFPNTEKISPWISLKRKTKHKNAKTTTKSQNTFSADRKTVALPSMETSQVLGLGEDGRMGRRFWSFGSRCCFFAFGERTFGEMIWLVGIFVGNASSEHCKTHF